VTFYFRDRTVFAAAEPGHAENGRHDRRVGGPKSAGLFRSAIMACSPTVMFSCAQARPPAEIGVLAIGRYPEAGAGVLRGRENA
jgi:hypothetical protein